MEIAIIKRETTGSGTLQVTCNSNSLRSRDKGLTIISAFSMHEFARGKIETKVLVLQTHCPTVSSVLRQ